jgi:hypothetical protein
LAADKAKITMNINPKSCQPLTFIDVPQYLVSSFTVISLSKVGVL